MKRKLALQAISATFSLALLGDLIAHVNMETPQFGG
jgi:hypothetical protein